jgi:hypothetical protein
MPASPIDVCGPLVAEVCAELAASTNNNYFMVLPLLLSLWSAAFGPGAQVAIDPSVGAEARNILFWGVVASPPSGGGFNQSVG